MSEELILERFDRLEQLIARLQGGRLTRDEMADRLRISGKTLTDRVRRGLAPEPCKDGKWLLSEVLEWESSQTTRNV
jgi:predicted DNA-binding transcriptional regulator AlpA